jgi:hypothetical protein
MSGNPTRLVSAGRAAARAGIEWMRERYRERGERAPF